MNALIVAARDFARDEEGISAIEYGLLAAVIAGVIVGAFNLLGTNITNAFTRIGEVITAALPADPTP